MDFICKKCGTITEGKVIAPEKSNLETILVMGTIVMMIAHWWLLCVIVLAVAFAISAHRWATSPLVCEVCDSRQILPTKSEAGKKLIQKYSTQYEGNNVLPFKRKH